MRMSTADLSIVTGASRGMGAAIALQLLREGHRLLCISRNVNAELAAAAPAGACEQWTEDLALAAPVAARLASWLATLDAGAFRSVTLINNAAAIPAIVPLQAADPAELTRTLRVGLEAPILLTAAFLRGTAAWPARADGACKVLNISSGLGRRAMASQASYCAVKAGLDHFTRSVALDQAGVATPARIVSLAPGVIETDMQVHLRGSDPAQFPDHARFVELKSAGHLDSPAAAAGKVIAYLRRADFGSNPVADVRDP
jgi:NAD(P)-dependent dehydrogenase (short-subunit alcohol dehydrogenase family)